MFTSHFFQIFLQMLLFYIHVEYHNHISAAKRLITFDLSSFDVGA